MILFLVNNVDSNEPHSVESVWIVCLGDEDDQILESQLWAYWYTEFSFPFISDLSYMVLYGSEVQNLNVSGTAILPEPNTDRIVFSSVSVGSDNGIHRFEVHLVYIN